ncbi:hypothetical protein [Methanolapillus ohkumae]|uniref:Uncharacterized protein n=1 Tax=Methanolapillus ohkumae TaxID=3028298 RepID=A0AA97A6N5_9EURY|nr:hypothetical protein MsAm2_12880 [Methanosarcinaceae archaeon Am2]
MAGFDLITMYIVIGIFAYVAILYLTYRDLRIFRRTGYFSYRKGALKGIIASTFVLIGIFLIPTVNDILGLALIFVGLMINQKGTREEVFTNATAFERFIGKTDIVRTPEEIKADYLRQQEELEKEKKKKYKK